MNCVDILIDIIFFCFFKVDGMVWMVFYCVEMLNIVFDFVVYDDMYEDMVFKFFEYFI